MKINYIFHEYMEDEVPRLDESFSNVVIVPRNQLIDERSLVFGPIVLHGTIALHNNLKFNLLQAGWPNLIWPFNQDNKIFSYSGLPKTLELLNSDFKGLSSWSTYSIKWPSWIRSDSGNKLFSGGVFEEKEFEGELQYLRTKGIESFQIVTAAPKKIYKEWRTIFIGGVCVGGSQYMDEGEESVINGVPYPALDFANAWNNKHGHIYGGNYVLDVCEGPDKKIYVLEINCISTSGWYGINTENVINAITNSIKKLCRQTI